MARGGQNIKSKEELKANGTYRPAYHANRLEVAPVSDMPPPPPHFDEKHRAKWDEICGQLFAAGIIAKQDYDAIVVYVENWLMAAEAFADIQKNGMTLWADSAGGSKPFTNPAFRQYMECQKIIKPLFDQFGFTPRARMGMKVEPKKEKTDPVADLMKAMNATTRKDA